MTSATCSTRSVAGAPAPAWGLYLDQVFYDWHKPENESEG